MSKRKIRKQTMIANISCSCFEGKLEKQNSFKETISNSLFPYESNVLKASGKKFDDMYKNIDIKLFYDQYEANYEIYADREETDAEMDKRIKEENRKQETNKKRKETIKQKELKELQRLKRKYENA